jgi:transposase
MRLRQTYRMKTGLDKEKRQFTVIDGIRYITYHGNHWRTCPLSSAQRSYVEDGMNRDPTSLWVDEQLDHCFDCRGDGTFSKQSAKHRVKQ